MLMVKLMFLASRTVGSAKRVGGAKRGKAAWPRVISHHSPPTMRWNHQQCDGTTNPNSRTCSTLPKLNIHWSVVIFLISSCLSPSAKQDDPEWAADPKHQENQNENFATNSINGCRQMMHWTADFFVNNPFNGTFYASEIICYTLHEENWVKTNVIKSSGETWPLIWGPKHVNNAYFPPSTAFTIC